MTVFGITLEPAVFWVIVAVLVVAIIAIIAIPIYKGYKKEMEKTAKKSGAAKKGTSTKRK